MMEVWSVVAVIAFALAPWVPVWRISDRYLKEARNTWLLATLGVAAVWLATVEPMFAFVALGLMIRWRSHRLLPSLVTWSAIAGMWFAMQAMPREFLRWLPYAWLAAGACQGLLLFDEWMDDRRVGGTIGQRTLTGAYCALVFPFAIEPSWATGAIPFLLLGLLITCSWLAFVALFAGLAVLEPWTIPGIAALVGAAYVAYRTKLLEKLPRGDTLDTFWQRWDTARLLVHHGRRWPLWLAGRGPYNVIYDIMRWDSRYKATLIHGHAHNEPLEFVYEYGLCGALALVAFVVRVAPHLRVGDPWTAAAVIGGVTLLGSIGTRVVPFGVVWWAIVGGMTR